MHAKPAILLVDDNADVCRSISMIFSRKGYDVAVAHDGLEAVQTVEKKRFNFILLDIKMPRMNGAEAHRRIMEMRPESYVAIMTAYADEQPIWEVLQQGAEAVLRKPVEVNDLLSIVEVAGKPRRSERMLVLSDSIDVAVDLKNILSSRGYKVDSGGACKDALATIGEHAYDIVFVDFDSFVADCPRICQVVEEKAPAIELILVTSDRKEAADMMGSRYEPGGCLILDKPINEADTIKQIETALARRRTSDASGDK